MANEDTRPETQEPEVRDVPSTDASQPRPEATHAEVSEASPSAAKPHDPPELTTPAEPHAVPHQRPIFLPLLFGGIIAAVIGFGLARVIPGGWPVQDMSPLRAEIQRQAQEITALRDQIGALSIPNLAPLEGRVSALENPEVKAADLQAQIEELRGQIGNGTISSELQAEIDRTQQELADAQAQAQTLQQQAEEAARSNTVSAALTRIAGALDSGTPFNAALADLQEAGVDVPQPLTDNAGGVPSIPALQQDFPAAARAALEASLKVDGGAGLGDRVGAFLRAQTGARSLAPREGDDPDAILSRAEAAVQAGDLGTALSEIGNLPLEGQAAMSDWRAKAERRIAVRDALTQLESR